MGTHLSKIRFFNQLTFILITILGLFFTNSELHARNIDKCDVGSEVWNNCVGDFVFDNGDRYFGEWNKNERNGYGFYVYADGLTVAGYYQNGEDVKNSFFRNNVNKCKDVTETWNNCVGDFVFDNGDRYFGEWNKNERNGYGFYVYANGLTQAGYYQNNEYYDTIPTLTSVQTNEGVRSDQDGAAVFLIILLFSIIVPLLVIKVIRTQSARVFDKDTRNVAVEDREQRLGKGVATQKDESSLESVTDNPVDQKNDAPENSLEPSKIEKITRIKLSTILFEPTKKIDVEVSNYSELPFFSQSKNVLVVIVCASSFIAIPVSWFLLEPDEFVFELIARLVFLALAVFSYKNNVWSILTLVILVSLNYLSGFLVDGVSNLKNSLIPVMVVISGTRSFLVARELRKLNPTTITAASSKQKSDQETSKDYDAVARLPDEDFEEEIVSARATDSSGLANQTNQKDYTSTNQLIYHVKYTVKCKPGWIFKKNFKYSYQASMSSVEAVEDDIFDFVNNFPWLKLEFLDIIDKDISLINENPTNADVIRANQTIKKQFVPTARAMHYLNGTLNDNEGGGGGNKMPKSAKFAGAAYIGYKIGKSNITG